MIIIIIINNTQFVILVVSNPILIIHGHFFLLPNTLELCSVTSS